MDVDFKYLQVGQARHCACSWKRRRREVYGLMMVGEGEGDYARKMTSRQCGFALPVNI